MLGSEEHGETIQQPEYNPHSCYQPLHMVNWNRNQRGPQLYGEKLIFEEHLETNIRD
jgi:hypothetical protein